ncbi:GPW/gp25 family protein [Alteromonas sp. a30]|uniref:GPW/gp25 family protein n=1 Tax=Alteromonas sp. a30 TaxID=2730917 RepID=UPI0022819912|nr:GPW/gp25 family protein [Alteromonas sp. a30]MCY7295106.1 hypothetical protein [Alteromonas sp. a30]
MAGTNAITGEPLSGVAHVRQSIRIILSTPLGSRVGLRTFGSRLYDLIDKPTTDSWGLDVIAATAEALLLWEPRFRLDDVSIQQTLPGKIILNVSGEYLPNGEPLTIDGIVINDTELS